MNYTPLGGICVSLGLMKVEDVHRVLARMARGEHARFGELAVEMGLIDESGLALALAEQYQLNLVPDHRVESLEPSREALDALPRALIRRNQMVPLRLHAQQRVLTLLMADPTNLPAIRHVQTHARGLRLRFFIATRQALRQLIDRLFGPPDQEEIYLEASTNQTFAAVPGFRVERMLVLETDPVRLVLLRRLDELENGRTEFIQDPEQVSSLLLTGDFSRIVYRTELQPLVAPYSKSWLRIRPDLQVYTQSAFNLDARVGVEPRRASRFYLDLLTFAVLGSEFQDVAARVRIRRLLDLVRAVAGQLGLPFSQVDNVVLGTLLVEMESLSLARTLVREREAVPGEASRFSVARSILAAWSSPFDVEGLLDALERRLGGGGPIGGHLGAEVVYTSRAIARRLKPGDTEPARILGEDVYHHLPRVLHAVSDVLKWEAFCPDMAALQQSRSEILLGIRDPALLTALELELASAGFRVLQAIDGQTIQRQARVRCPRCIVVDFHLPRLSGLQLLAALKSEPITSEVPVIMISGPRPGADAAEALDRGAEDVVAPPVSVRLLVAKIRRLANRSAVDVGLQGRIRDLPLPDLVQTLSLGGRTAVIRVVCESDSGELYLAKGQLRFARYVDSVGEVALRQLVSLRDGRFRVEFDATPPGRNLHGASEWLLLEALRVQDEEGVVFDDEASDIEEAREE